MRLPIFVVGDADIFLVPTIERASYFEPIDIENGEYRAWDGDGRPLTIRVGTRSEKSLFGSREVETAVFEDVPGAAADDPALDEAILRRLPGYDFGQDVGERRARELRDFVRQRIAPL